ncbi:hypothetical protein SteCoe_37304 [Stentor coeruleus]|uniref:UVR domain-containing protein n=1 Tax=Stentor coeruleus TaxID=5963 RepID=A0A1R2ANI6_9CILI|nr:hypothetical protein SteCoe_37304 [Stentor coeruleus]
MSGILNKVFGKKEEQKGPEKSGMTMFSGLAMKKSAKPESNLVSGYMPPTKEIVPPKLPEPYMYKPPEQEPYRPQPQKSYTEASSMDSTEVTKSSDDPFADIKISEEQKQNKKAVIPGFGDSDDEDDFNFVKKTKLAIVKDSEVPQIPHEPAKIEPKKVEETHSPYIVQTEKPSIYTEKPSAYAEKPSVYAEKPSVYAEKPSVYTEKPSYAPERPQIEKNVVEYRKADEPKPEELKKPENRILKMIEEKKRKDHEEKERKEREEKEEKLRIEAQKTKEREDKLRSEQENLRKAEEARKMLNKVVDPNSLKEIIDEKMKEFTDAIANKILMQESMKNKTKSNLESIKKMQSQIAELQYLEDQAASQEDFEEAAKLHEELESLELNTKDIQQTIQTDALTYSRLEDEKSSLILQKRQWIESTLALRSDALNKLKAELESQKAKAETKRSKMAEEFSVESEKIKNREGELLEIKGSVNEKKQELDQKIYEKTEVMQEEEKKLTLELTTLDGEIKELEEILLKKKTQAKIVSSSLQESKAKLNKCLEEFDEEVKEADEAEKVVIKDIEDVQKTKFLLEKQEYESKDEYEQFLRFYESKENDNRIFQDLLSNLEQEIEAITSLEGKRKNFLEEIETIQAMLKDKESLLLEAQEFYNSSKENIDFFKDLIRQQDEKNKDIEKRIPVLENEKKIAASAKQFKEASRLNNEIKDLNTECVKIKENIQKMHKELLEKEENLLTIEKNADEVREEILKYQTMLEETKGKLLNAEAQCSSLTN